MDIQKKIQALKQEKNAIILAHNYQVPEIQDIADFVGDSLELARKAAGTDARIIMFSAVDFMAEIAAILNPDKKVIVPEPDAKCPMAHMLSSRGILKAKREHPNAKVVLYVNTLAEHKALADCCCTSANAPRIVNALDAEEVIFGPDENLAYYVKQNSSKKVHTVPEHGYCKSHVVFRLDDVLLRKQEHPDAELVVHPECIPEVQEHADKIASTSGMLKHVRSSQSKKFIIGTETGLLYRLQKENTEKEFIPLSEDSVCENMKKNTLEKVYKALKEELNEVKVSKETAEKARKGIELMLELS